MIPEAPSKPCGKPGPRRRDYRGNLTDRYVSWRTCGGDAYWFDGTYWKCCECVPPILPCTITIVPLKMRARTIDPVLGDTLLETIREVFSVSQ